MKTMLHIVNKSPFEKNSLASCLRIAQPGSSVLLIEDAVYAAVANADHADDLNSRASDLSFYILGPDVAARGLSDTPLISNISVVNYEGFVDLVATHEANQSWL